MLLSLKKELRVRLSPDQCIKCIEENLQNITSNFSTTPYRFRKSGFYFFFLKKPDFWFQTLAHRRALPTILGYIKKTGDYTTVSLTIFPPPLVYILIWLAPVLILSRVVFLHPNMVGGAIITTLVWCLLVGIAVRSRIKKGLEVIDNIEKVLNSASTNLQEEIKSD